MPRVDFSNDLKLLEDGLLQMANMVEEAVDRALEALAKRDLEASAQVIRDDDELDQMQIEIEEKCIELIATQQPMAGDLRALVTVLSIVSDLERMGDYAEGIGKISLLMGDEPPIKPLIDIPLMADKAKKMLEGSLEALVNRDVELAAQVSIDDDEVDSLYDQVYRELLTYMIQDPKNVQRATYLLWVAHDLERLADRATNIAERVIYLVTGQQVTVEVSPSTVRVREQQGKIRRQTMARSPSVPGAYEQFYELLQSEASNLNTTAHALAEMMDDFTSVEEKAQKIRDLEHTGDEIIHSIMRLLHGTFVTPLDRQDIQNLAERLDDVVDHIEEAARDIQEFKIDAPTPQAAEVAHVLQQAGVELEKAVGWLPTMRNRKDDILELCRSISTLEEEADRVGREALIELFNDGRSFNEVMKWREVYQHLEEAADSCQGAAIVIEGIVLEYA